MKTNTHFSSYFARFFLEWEMFLKKVVDKIKTHILCSIPPPKKNSDSVVKYCKPRQATDDSMAHAHFMLDT